MTYEEFQAMVRQRKRERWPGIVAGESPERPAGRRPRDPDQERLLTQLDRQRLERDGIRRR